MPNSSQLNHRRSESTSAPISPESPELPSFELDPYLVHSRIEILGNLRVLVDQHVLATVYFDRGSDFIVTRFLGINPEFEELIFDLSPDARTNEKLQASDGLTVVAFLDQIKVQFAVNRAELTLFQAAPAFRIRTPQALLRLQRREAFRARTQITRSPHVQLPASAAGGSSDEGTRVRIADISATGFACMATAGRPLLQAGQRYANCRLELRDGEVFDVDIEIRHVTSFKDGFGREMCRAGCRFLKISGPTEMAVQRYVNECEIAVRGFGDKRAGKY